jgi:hypothetical protein
MKSKAYRYWYYNTYINDKLKDLNGKQALKFLNKEINRVKIKLKITCFKQKLCKHNKYMFDINKLLCELDSLQRKYDSIC